MIQSADYIKSPVPQTQLEQTSETNKDARPSIEIQPIQKEITEDEPGKKIELLKKRTVNDILKDIIYGQKKLLF